MPAPVYIDAATVAKCLPYPLLVEQLRKAFLAPPTAPDRLAVPVAAAHGQTAGTLLVMPAVAPGRIMGVKLVTVLPELANREGGALRSIYMVLDAPSGEPLCLIDGHALTNRRTAAASALAASLLARPDSRTLLVVGTGGVCEALAQAYRATLPIDRILIWGRNPDRARDLANRLGEQRCPTETVADLETGLAQADIVTAATLSRAPLLFASQVRPGTHVDLVGGFLPQMREADDSLVGAARVFADVQRTITEAGDICGPIASGALRVDSVTLLDDLLRKPALGRQQGAEITLFKSAGHALEDLAAAELVVAAHLGSRQPTHQKG